MEINKKKGKRNDDGARALYFGGPIFYRWMYPIKMFLCKLKYYYRNKRYPERSIVEGYLVEECLTFCYRYLEDVETRFNGSN
ncbi:hypothetical protein GQ457_11G029230 [Hibiscus cannabinus]